MKIEITFYPDVKKPIDGSGTFSEANWHNKPMSECLDKLFNIQPDERLEGIIVTESGIKARIGKV